jgi:hypothetical protein
MELRVRRVVFGGGGKQDCQNRSPLEYSMTGGQRTLIAITDMTALYEVDEMSRSKPYI